MSETVRDKNRYPTDRQILQAIYDEYVDQYPGTQGANDPFMAVDFDVIASRLGSSARMVSGRLQALTLKYYHYEDGRGGFIDLYSFGVAGKGPAVRFPILASALADYRERHWQQRLAVRLSVLSLVAAATALIMHSSPN
jgi:hypothetical protein